MSKMPNISDSDLEKIAARKNFKGEDDFGTLDAAMVAAKARSMTTLRAIHIFQDGTRYWVNAHGVPKVGQLHVKSFKRGVEI